MKKRLRAYGIADAGLAVSFIPPASAQIEYARNFVAAPNHGAVTVTGFNNFGQVSGFYNSDAIPGFTVTHGFFWDPQTGFHDVAPQGAASNMLAALSEQGRALGSSAPLGGFFRETSGAVQWQDFGGFDYGSGKILTDASQIAGHLTVDGHSRAARWDAADGALDIGRMLSTTSDSDAVSIGNSGFVCGYWNTGAAAIVNGWSSPVSHAFVWSPGAGAAVDLGGLGGYFALPASVNNNGQVVGRAATPGNTVVHAFLASPAGTMQDLNASLGEPAGSNSYAADINNNGEIIGHSDTVGNFVLSGGVRAIHYAAAGHPMSYASVLYRINDKGAILGTGEEYDPATSQENPGFIVLTPNRVPTNESHSYTTFEDTPLSVPTGPLLRGMENQNLAILTAELYTPVLPSLSMTAKSSVAHGSVVLNPNGSFVYTPALHFSGVDHFDFRLFDGISYSLPATVTITVLPVSYPPVASDSAQTLDEDTQAVITPHVFDANGNSLTYSITKNPAHGQLIKDAGTLIYLPSPNYHGADSFQYKAFDGQAYSNVATVSLTIKFVNDPPTVGDRSLTVYQGKTFSQSAPGLLSTATDIDGGHLTVSPGTAPQHGALTLAADGSFAYTAFSGYLGNDGFTFVVSDGQGGSATGRVSITVNPVAQDVTSWVAISRGGYVRTPGSATFTQKIVLTNISQRTLAGPIAFVLDNPRNATLVNATGVTTITSPAGSPYVDQAISNMAPGEGFSITLKFSDPTLTAITYNPRVLAGPGAR